MECPDCGIVNVIHEGGHLWCSLCGTSIQEKPQYVIGYNNSHYIPRQQIYNRQKRFNKWVLVKCGHRSDVLSKMRPILDHFRCYEFTFHIRKDLTKRIYFFAKSVMLKICCEHVNVSIEGLPTLKDINREIDQKKELIEMQKTDDWKMIAISKLNYIS